VWDVARIAADQSTGKGRGEWSQSLQLPCVSDILTPPHHSAATCTEFCFVEDASSRFFQNIATNILSYTV